METNTPSNDAAALTPSLFLGHYLSLEHEKFVDSKVAVDDISNGKTVLVSNNTDALLVMVKLGIPIPEALEKIRLAITVLPDSEPIVLQEF
jgi:hypothetical protein